MEAHRLRAPSADGALLAEPPLGEAAGRLADNAERLDAWAYDFQGRRASSLRPAVRSQVLRKAGEFLASAGFDPPATAGSRLVVTGHQPELFHPGVWVKNFALAAIARSAGAGALNIIVDNDIPKGSTVKVPRVVGDALRAERVDFDAWAGEVPYEDLRVLDEGLFASFGGRAREALGGAVADPVLDEFWPRAVEAARRTDKTGLRFALARRGVEAAWGVDNAEVPLSAVCETEGFLWFASHLLAHLPRFRQVHNDALDRYRALYGIRSRHHPVPALGGKDGWLEAPFWVWRDREPRRRPLLARQNAKTIELRIDGEAEPLLETPLGPDRDACCAVEQLRELPARGVRLRTRALTTTMFSRYLLGDLFLHGIGGAKYDELGDEVSGRFFGVEPPGYMTLSMTLWLGLDDAPGAAERLADVERILRDLEHNPDRHLDDPPGDPDAARWVEAKRTAVAGPVETHAQRKARFHEIRRCNAALRGHVEARRVDLLGRRAGLASGVKRNTLAHSREYALVLHSRGKLRGALERAIPGLTLSGG